MNQDLQDKTLDLCNADCTKCALSELRPTQVVNGVGPLDAKVMIVGEAPGPDEDIKGEPFIGRAGKKLDSLLARVGIHRSQLRITNATRCFPRLKTVEGFRAPDWEEMKKCLPYLDQEVAFVKPNVIVPVGNVALRALLEDKKASIGDYRGREIWSVKYNCKIMPTYHPSAVMRNPTLEETVVQDFKRIWESSQYKEMTSQQEGNYIIIDTIEKFDAFYERISQVKEFSYDIESSGFNWQKDHVMCVSFSWKKGTAVVLPITKWIGIEKEKVELKDKKVRRKGITEVKQVEVVTKYIEDTYQPWWGEKQSYIMMNLMSIMTSDISRIAQNGKFDDKFFLQKGWKLQPLAYDTLLMHYLLHETAKGQHGLKDMALQYTQMGEYDRELEEWFDANGMSADKNRNYAHVPESILYKYSAMDADVTFQLKQIFLPLIEQEGMLDLLERLVMPLNYTLTITEFEGYKIDRVQLNKVKNELQMEMAAKEKEIKDLILKAGITNEVDLDSPKQLVKLFFEDLKLPIVKQTKKGAPCTDEEAMTLLKDKHEIPMKIVEYRGIAKLLRTYVIGIEEKLDDNDRLHTSFYQDGTESGRLSCVPLNSEILTRKGWKTYDKLNIGEEVMGFDIQLNSYRWTKLLEVNKGKDIVGLIKTNKGHAKPQGVLCTSNHKWIGISEKLVGFAEAKGFPRRTNLLLQPRSEMPTIEKSILTPDEAALFGWYLTDGFKTGKKHYGLGINLIKFRSRKILEELLLNISHTKSIYNRPNYGHHKIHAYHISSKIFDEIYCKAKSYSPAEFILLLSTKARKAMFAAMLEADGSMRTGAKRYDRFGALESFEKKTKEYFEVLSLSLGQPFTFRKTPAQHRKDFNRRAFINYQLIANIPLYADKNHKWKPIEEMDVWCPQTECGTWVMRQGHHVVVTGNSRDPNLQNIVKDKRIKDMFVVDEGNVLVEADEAQGEFRLWGAYSKDPQLLKDLLDNLDIHRNTAAMANKITIEQATDDQRQKAKSIVFGLMFGEGVEDLSKKHDVTIEYAQLIKDTFFRRYPVAKQWRYDNVKRGKRDGYVTSFFGRRRHLPGINSEDNKVSFPDQQAAVNSPIQGCLSDYTANAGNRILIKFKELGFHGKTLNLVHDAIYMEIPKVELEESLKIMKEEMERRILGIEVPMVAEFKIGKKWGELKSVKSINPIVYKEEKKPVNNNTQNVVENTIK
jgi:uracil-DNA glycosylase family 4